MLIFKLQNRGLDRHIEVLVEKRENNCDLSLVADSALIIASIHTDGTTFIIK